MKTITQRKLCNDFKIVLREVQAGETFLITRNGEPIAELRPFRRGRFVSRAVIAQAATRAPRINAGRFRGDIETIIDQSPHS